jgi:iron(III) transport system ATP-binding protein
VLAPERAKLAYVPSFETCMHHHEILRQVTLGVGVDEVLAIVGPSGSGKSTLLRVVLGFVAPSSGSVRVNGMIASAQGRITVPPEERHFAMVFQDLALWPHMTVREHLQFAVFPFQSPITTEPTGVGA